MTFFFFLENFIGYFYVLTQSIHIQIKNLTKFNYQWFQKIKIVVKQLKYHKGGRYFKLKYIFLQGKKVAAKIMHVVEDIVDVKRILKHKTLKNKFIL